MKPRTLRLPDGRIWLRVASPAWVNPLDPAPAQERGGRWNAPGSVAALYVNADIATARLQIERMLAGSPVTPDDLDDGAYLLVAATVPTAQIVADAVTAGGLRALGLPERYPRDARGHEVGHTVCRVVGQAIRQRGLRGLWCRSACTADGRGRELAWFPATARSRATPCWDTPLPFGLWRYASTWSDIGLEEQRDPDA